MSVKDTAGANQLEWIQTKKIQIKEEGKLWARFWRKFGENPAVPLGALATVGALTFGLISFGRGDSQMSQYMMRLRVAAQAFTLITLTYAMYKAGERSTLIERLKNATAGTSETATKAQITK